VTAEPQTATSPSTTDPIHTRAQMVARSGIDAGFIDRLCELGILTPKADDRFTEGDVRRARILHALDSTGLPLDSLAEAIRTDEIDLGFVDDPAYSLFAGLTDETFDDASSRTGIPIELLFAIREAMGSPQPTVDDRIRELETGVIPAVELMVGYGIRPAVIERALRAFGDNLRRMAEVESDWWMSDVIQPVIASGGSLSDVGARTAEFANDLAPLSERLILAMYHGHQTNSWMKNFFEGFEAGMTKAGLYKPIDRPPAIAFLDLSGYTRLTEDRGDAAAAELAGQLARVVQRTSTLHGGKAVKWLGDGVMFHFRDPGPGVVAALEMVEGAREAGLPPAHVGVHAGPVLFQEGDYFGRTVNIASRIADYARQGEVLVTDEVVAATDVPGVRFDPIGPVELKGLTEAVPLHVARRVGESGATR
jgi:adenylate cyclase